MNSSKGMLCDVPKFCTKLLTLNDVHKYTWRDYTRIIIKIYSCITHVYFRFGVQRNCYYYL